MLNRLGMWNRLALVVTVLAVFFAPIAILLNIQHDLYELRAVWYEHCKAVWNGRELEAGYAQAHARCLDDFLKPSTGAPWGDYWELALGTLIVCAAIYGLIWIVVATIKWIWRGREAGKAPSPVRTTPLGNETD